MECMLAFHITAAITACILTLTRANRLAAMRESQVMKELHTHPVRPPAIYVCPSNYYLPVGVVLIKEGFASRVLVRMVWSGL